MADEILRVRDASAAGQPREPRIMIVDDEAVCARFLSARLTEDGCAVRVATNGSQAVELGRSFSPDVLVSDWMLKDSLTGIDVARELDSCGRPMQVIFFTGLSALELTARVRGSGLRIFRIYEKPCRVEHLANGVRDALRELHALTSIPN